VPSANEIREPQPRATVHPTPDLAFALLDHGGWDVKRGRAVAERDGVRIECIEDGATLVHTFDARPFRGKRVAFTARVGLEAGEAAVVISTASAEQHERPLSFHVKAGPVVEQRMVVDILPFTDTLTIGIQLAPTAGQRAGRMWISHLRLDTIDGL
jgi:hypothetical protein